MEEAADTCVPQRPLPPPDRVNGRHSARRPASHSPQRQFPEPAATARRGDRAGGLADLYAPVQLELDAAEAVLIAELASPHRAVGELSRHAALLGGKRLRPALLLLAGKASGVLVPEHVRLAAALEMIHTATLVHDDVLDGASIRRRLPTVNSAWGTPASVLLGDYLFTHAFYLASTTGDAEVCRLIGAATNATCEGELRQIHSCGDRSLTEDNYLDILRAKTGELCACCCRLGARLSGSAAEVQESLARYGRRLGIAFQIADDILDLAGEEQVAGKSLGTDLHQQKFTLPLIRALAGNDRRQRQQVLQVLEAPPLSRRQQLQPLLEATGALEYSRNRALEFAELAQAELTALPPSPARDSLQKLAALAVTRSS